MNKQIEENIEKHKAHVPLLRFPEFKNAPAWEELPVGKICKSIVPGRNKPKVFNGNIPWVTTPEILGRYIPSSKQTHYISQLEATLCGAKLVPTGAVIIAAVGELGLTAIAKENVILNQQLHAFVCSNNIYNEYLAYFISRQHSYMYTVASKTTIPYMNKNNCESIPIFLPTLPEQQKIADCLSSLDAKIETQSKKIESLKNHKKGLMGQLFPKIGENLPRLRFPDFSNAPAWEEKTIADVCSISTGKSNTQDKIQNGQYPLYVRSPIIERSNKYLYNEEAVLTVGDGVGTGKVYHYVNGKYDLHQRVYRLYNFKNIIGKLLFYYFSTYFGDRVSKMSAKNAVDSVRMDMIANMPIFVCSLPEQQKITDCLSSLDRCIKSHSHKFNLLKQYKKGLMQQLFPQGSEVNI